MKRLQFLTDVRCQQTVFKMGKKKNKKSLSKSKHNGSLSLDSYFLDYYRTTDKTMLFILMGFYLFGIGLSFYYDTWILGLGAGSATLGVYLLTYTFFRGKFLNRAVASLLLWNFSAQFIAQMHGMYEMHFFFFIACTILLIYQDWKVIVPITLYTVIHHIGFYVLNYTGDIDGAYKNYFVDVDYLTISTFIIHLGVAAIHAILCIFGALKIRKMTVGEVSNSILLETENQKHAEQQIQIKHNIELANEISQGKLDSTIQNKNSDTMTEALLLMRESLKDAKEKETKERFVIEGLGDIESILRANNNNLKVLSDKVMSKITNYVNAAQGALFLIEDKKGTQAYLELTGAYAYDRSKFINKKILPGEGLAGECWIEEKAKILEDLPNEYVEIRSALGKANPQNIYIIPLTYNEKILGVLEIASFEKFDALKMEFVNRVAENIAGSVSAVKVNEQTSRLLQESQDLTEQMRAQEEELRQNQEEMMATQEETNRQMNEMRAKYEEAQNKLEELQKP